MRKVSQLLGDIFPAIDARVEVRACGVAYVLSSALPYGVVGQ
jgi:hypothetical protein